MYFEEQEKGIRQVFVATVDGKAAGYATLLPQDTTGPFKDRNIPTIVDFNVLMKYQKKGVGAAIMDRVKAALDREKIDYIELGGAVPNPRLSLVYRGIELAKRKVLTLSWPLVAEVRLIQRKQSDTVLQMKGMYGISMITNGRRRHVFQSESYSHWRQRAVR